MSTPMENRQRETDYQRGLHDQRQADKARFGVTETVRHDFDPKSPTFDLWNADAVQLRERIQFLMRPVTDADVERFFVDRLNEMQSAIPEYASLSLEVSRHLWDGKFEPERVKWQGYFTSGTFFPIAPFDKSVHLADVMGHVSEVAKGRDPINVAKKLREQSAHLLAQAEQVEKNAALKSATE